VVLQLREELENARQDGAKSLECAQEKMNDKVKELRNETDKLKVRHFFCSVEQ